MGPIITTAEAIQAVKTIIMFCIQLLMNNVVLQVGIVIGFIIFIYILCSFISYKMNGDKDKHPYKDAIKKLTSL